MKRAQSGFLHALSLAFFSYFFENDCLCAYTHWLRLRSIDVYLLLALQVLQRPSSETIFFFLHLTTRQLQRQWFKLKE